MLFRGAPRVLAAAGVWALAQVWGPKLAAADPAVGITPSDLSLISTHLNPHGLSHILPHLVPTPPGPLLSPLGDESLTSIAKGFAPSEESALAGQLLAAPLHQRLLRVAVASVDGSRMALVKLQAGDKLTGAFAVADLEADALTVLEAAASGVYRFEQVDLWSVVPWMVGGARLQRPVFSVSAMRPLLALVTSGPTDARDLLRRCGVVRYSPVFLDYALEEKAEGGLQLPSWAFSDPPLREQWPKLLAEAPVEELVVPAAHLDDPVDCVAGGPPGRCGKMVALTIDDGPHPLITPLILETLRKGGVNATFFLVGEQVEQFPALARAITAAGHEVANHTYTHPHLAGLGPSEVWAELEASRRVVARVTGVRMRWFRPPGGDADAALLQYVHRMGYATVLWTHNTGDWEKLSPEKIAARALRDLVPGSIILMHQDELQSAQALPAIVEAAREKGLTLVPLRDLVSTAHLPQHRPSEIIPFLEKAGL